MAVDFSGIKSETVVGRTFDFRDSKHYVRNTTFGEVVRPYSLDADTRWKAYASMRDDVASIEKRQRNRKIVNFEVEARDAWRKEALVQSMQLIVDAYLSKGNIGNASYFDRL